MASTVSLGAFWLRPHTPSTVRVSARLLKSQSHPVLVWIDFYGENELGITSLQALSKASPSVVAPSSVHPAYSRLLPETENIEPSMRESRSALSAFNPRAPETILNLVKKSRGCLCEQPGPEGWLQRRRAVPEPEADKVILSKDED